MRRTALNRLQFALIPLFALLTLGAGAQSSAADIPYIHYYDYLQQGLVIERADGTDSRLIPISGAEGHNTVRWRAWSPSGRWLAISTYALTVAGGHSDQEIHVLSADGQRRLSLGTYGVFNAAADAADVWLQWSPSEDLLLIVAPDIQRGEVQMQVYDVERERVRAAMRVQQPGLDLYTPIQLSWSPDGQTAYSSWEWQVVSLHHDGTTAVWVDTPGMQARVQPQFHRGRLLSAHAIVQNTSVTLRLRDFHAPRTIDIEDPAWRPAPSSYRVYWSPSLDYALIYAPPCVDDGCEPWLKLVHWQTGAVLDVTPAVQPGMVLNPCDHDHCSGIWSPSEQFAAFRDVAGRLFIVEVATGTLRSVAPDREAAVFHWGPDESLFVTFGSGAGLYRYDPFSAVETAIALPLDTNNAGIFLSPDGAYIALLSEPPTVVDHTGRLITQTRPHSHTMRAGPAVWGYGWHAGSQWLLANAVIAFDGGTGPIASLVFNVEGSVRRELPTGGGAGFVPDNTVALLPRGQATSVKKEPLYTLPQRGLVEGVSWHPTNVHQLVGYSNARSLTFWSLADSAPQILEQREDIPPYPSFMPYGLQLFWLPDRDIVAFYFRELQTIDPQSGQVIAVEGVTYPILEPATSGYTIRSSTGADSLALDPAVPLGDRWVLTTDQAGFIVTGRDDHAPNYYVDAFTGAITLLEVNGTIWTADAHREAGIGVFGSMTDCCIQVVDLASGQVIDQFYTTASSLAFSADGRRMATAAHGMINIWDMSPYLGGE